MAMFIGREVLDRIFSKEGYYKPIRAIVWMLKSVRDRLSVTRRINSLSNYVPLAMDRRIFLYSVISSVIASIAFSWLLEPFTRWVWNYATISASSWLIDLQNAAFRNAALGKRDRVTAVMFLYWTGTSFAVLTGFLTGASLTVLLIKFPDDAGSRIRESAAGLPQAATNNRVIVFGAGVSFSVLHVGENVLSRLR